MVEHPAPPASSPPIAPPRDRFLTFAFAAADLLVETGPDSRISWAAGAFASRYARPAESFIGQPVEELIAPADRLALARGLALAALHGRLAPLTLRLNDARQTGCALGALAVPDRAGRLCLTFASLPEQPVTPSAIAPDRGALAIQAEASLRAGQTRSLGLLDVSGWAAANGALSTAERKALRADIADTLAELGGPGVLVGEIGQGRYGVLGGKDLDVGALITALEGVMRASPTGHTARVSGQAIALAMPGLTPGQASRALRFALSRFADGGLAAVTTAGFARGLAGFISDAGGRAVALRARIAGHKFRLVYQPVVSLADRTPHHFEALIRPLAIPDGPTFNPQDFVTFVEALGLSEELDIAVAEEALTTLRETKQAHVAINISGLSMQSAAFRDRLMTLIGTESRLMMELTETADITDVEAVADMLRALRARGVPVCIDDFGAGSAAFRYLRDFRVDFVKIDGSYIRAATAGPRERGFVESMRDLARTVDAKVIAEMVETEAEAKLMASLGVEFAQGYLFGRPGQLPGARRR